MNEKARRSKVLPGLRYANALSLARDLRADVVQALGGAGIQLGSQVLKNL